MDKIIEFFTLDPSNTREFVAQLVGFIPLLLALITFALSKRSHIIISKTASDLTSAVHFFLLGEVVGGAICIVNTARGIFFYHRGRRPWTSHILVPIIFSVITLATSLLRWEGAVSLLPTVGSVLAIVGFWCNNPHLLKAFNLPAVTLWLIYSIITGSISAVLINIISIITIITSLFKMLLTHIKTRKNAPKNPENATQGRT